jgi:RNA-directed DNA polymerase
MYQGERIVKTTRWSRRTTVRSIAEKIELSIPQEKLAAFCHNKGYGNYDQYSMIHRSALLNLSDAEIITIYNAEFRGLVHYYLLAASVKKTLGKLQGIWIGSLLKTLARKHQCSVRKMARKLRVSQGEYLLTEKHKGKARTVRVFRMKDIEKHPLRYPALDTCPNTSRYRAVYSELARRMRAQRCEYCGRKDGYFEVHHVGQLKRIRNGTEKWQKMMNDMRRKTLVLCVECHRLLHDGELPEWRNFMYK